jgi:hypothetical protein
MSFGNCPTSGYFLENENGPVYPAKVTSVSQIRSAMDAFKQSLEGSSVDVCRDSMLNLHCVINGAAEACLIEDVNVYHKQTADILRNVKPGNQAVAEYIKLQLESFYLFF